MSYLDDRDSETQRYDQLGAIRNNKSSENRNIDHMKPGISQALNKASDQKDERKKCFKSINLSPPDKRKIAIEPDDEEGKTKPGQRIFPGKIQEDTCYGEEEEGRGENPCYSDAMPLLAASSL